MHGEAPPPFDGEEAALTTKTTWKTICIYIHVCMWYIDTYMYESWDIPEPSVAILDIPHIYSMRSLIPN